MLVRARESELKRAFASEGRRHKASSRKMHFSRETLEPLPWLESAPAPASASFRPGSPCSSLSRPFLSRQIRVRAAAERRGLERLAAGFVVRSGAELRLVGSEEQLPERVHLSRCRWLTLHLAEASAVASAAVEESADAVAAMETVGVAGEGQ